MFRATGGQLLLKYSPSSCPSCLQGRAIYCQKWMSEAGKTFPQCPQCHCMGTACAGVLPAYWLPNWEWGEPSTLNKRMRDNSGQLFGKLSVSGPTSPVLPMLGHLLGEDLFFWTLEKAGEIGTSLPVGSTSKGTCTPL